MSATITAGSAKKHDWGLFVLGILCLIACVLIFVWPGISLLAVAVIAGLMLCVMGVWDFALYTRLKDRVSGAGWYIASGICDLICGAIFLFNPVITAEMLPWLASIFVVAYGIAVCFAAAGASELQGVRGLMILNGILSIIIGVMFFVMPSSFMLFVAIYLAFRGVFMCFGAFAGPGAVGLY